MKNRTSPIAAAMPMGRTPSSPMRSPAAPAALSAPSSGSLGDAHFGCVGEDEPGAREVGRRSRGVRDDRADRYHDVGSEHPSASSQRSVASFPEHRGLGAERKRL